MLNFHASAEQPKAPAAEPPDESLMLPLYNAGKIRTKSLRHKHPMLRRVFTSVASPTLGSIQSDETLRANGNTTLKDENSSLEGDGVLLSLHEIAQRIGEQRRTESGNTCVAQRYRLVIQNRYAAAAPKPIVVEIKLIEVFFNNKRCQLVMLQDITQLLKDLDESGSRAKQLQDSRSTVLGELQCRQNALSTLATRLREQPALAANPDLLGLSIGLQVCEIQFRDYVDLEAIWAATFVPRDEPV